MLFDSTLRRELARNFGGTLVVILTIVLTILFIRTLGQAALGRVDPQDVALLLAYIALGNLPTMLAGSMFVAVVATLSRMYRASEMTIWFASGVSLQRFVRPVLQTSWPVLLVIALLALFAWPWQNERIGQLREVFERRSDLSRVAPGQFQSSGDGQRTFFFEGAASDTTSGRNVLIVASRGSVEAVTTARSGHIDSSDDGRFIVLDKGQRNEQDASNGQKTLSRFESFRSLAGERVVDPRETLPPKARPTLQLLREPSALNHGELVWRLGLVPRGQHASARHRHVSVELAPREQLEPAVRPVQLFAYYNLINLTQAWVAPAGSASALPALPPTARRWRWASA
jgi:lipopolysaccharide export system permease protein